MVAATAQVREADGLIGEAVSLSRQQLEASPGSQLVQEEFLQIYNFIVSPASGSEAIEVKVTSSPRYFGESSETEVMIGG